VRVRVRVRVRVLQRGERALLPAAQEVRQLRRRRRRAAARHVGDLDDRVARSLHQLHDGPPGQDVRARARARARPRARVRVCSG
jgi:hypothetical protein